MAALLLRRLGDSLVPMTTTMRRTMLLKAERGFGSALAPVQLAVNVSKVGVALAPETTALPRTSRGTMVDLLRGSAPYIQLHQNSIVVIHVSSELTDRIQDIMDDVATLHVLGVKVVLVMSVRTQLDEGRTSQFVRGLRVTGKDDLAAVQVECGVARSRVEAALAKGLAGSSTSKLGVDVISGNGFFTARPIGVLDGVDLGATGAVRQVETEKILRHLNAGEIVLLTALGYAASGETFNVRTEEVAVRAAPALGASKLVFVTPGHELVFLDDPSFQRVASLRLDDARRLAKRKDKIVVVRQQQGDDESSSSKVARDVVGLCEWAVSALERGVLRAHLVPPTRGALLQELYTRDGSGTLVASDLYEGIRTAKKSDLAAMLSLIEPLEADGILVARPRDDLERDVETGCYYVFARENVPIACAMLKRLDETDSAEIGCLVVDPDYRRQNKGDAMLSYLERVALANGIQDLFALSTRTMQWFLERGFDEVQFNDLPPDRRLQYDNHRKPKIYRKRLKTDRDVDFDEVFWSRPVHQRPDSAAGFASSRLPPQKSSSSSSSSSSRESPPPPPKASSSF